MKAAMSALDANTLPKPKTHSKAVALARRVEVYYATINAGILERH